MPELTKEQLYIILGAISVVLIGCVIGLFDTNSGIKQSSPISSPSFALRATEGKPEEVLIDRSQKTGISEQIFVHISGAVRNEGVFKLTKGDRLFELLRMAHADPDADLDSVNLAAILSDGQKIFIPNRHLQAISGSNAQAVSDNGAQQAKIININTADEKGFDSLPGIGPTTAKRIVEYREKNGQFSSIDELKEVQGISEKKFDKLKDLISVY